MASFNLIRSRVVFWCALLTLTLVGNSLAATKKAPPSLTPTPTYEPRYFFTIDLDPLDQVVGRGALTEADAATSNCYCFTYDKQGKIQRIEYRRVGVVMPDPFFQAARIDFEYAPGIERRWYRDAEGRPVKNVDGVSGEELTLNAANCPIGITNLNESGGTTRDSSGVIRYMRTLDNLGRLITGRRTGLLGTEITDENGYFETRTTYDDQGRRSEYANYDSSGNPLNNNDGVALVRTSYTLYPDSIESSESYFDASGVGTTEKGSDVHELRRTVDKRGFLLSESYYDINGAPTNDTDGIHERRYVYDDKGNQLSETFYGIDGKLKTERSSGYARVVYRYDAKNRVSEKAYFGDDGTPQILLNLGAAMIRQEYDDKGNLTRRQFFDGRGTPSRHAQYGAEAIRIKVEGDTTIVSLRDDVDLPATNPIGGYSSFTYNTLKDQPLTRKNHYYDRYGKRLTSLRVFVINPHIHALRSNPVMLWSARIGVAVAGLGALLACYMARRKASHTRRRKVYVPTPIERFLGWFAMFAIVEGTLRFLITIYWWWVGYQNGQIGSGVYVLEFCVIVFYLYRLTRLNKTMRILNILREDIERLIRDYLTETHQSPKWVAEQTSFVTDGLSVRLTYSLGKFHAYLAFYHVHRRDLSRGLAKYIRNHVRQLEGPPRSRAIAFYYPCVSVCYFILAVAAFYTLFELYRHH